MQPKCHPMVGELHDLFLDKRVHRILVLPVSTASLDAEIVIFLYIKRLILAIAYFAHERAMGILPTY